MVRQHANALRPGRTTHDRRLPRSGTVTPTTVDCRAATRRRRRPSAWASPAGSHRKHRESARIPAEALVDERGRLHVLPTAPHTMALGQTRSVNTDQTVRFGSVRYSTPPGLVWVRVAGTEPVIGGTGSGSQREEVLLGSGTGPGPRWARRPGRVLGMTASAG